MVPADVRVDMDAPCETELVHKHSQQTCVGWTCEERLGWFGTTFPRQTTTRVLTRPRLHGLAEALSDPEFHHDVTGGIKGWRFHHDRAFLDREITSETLVCEGFHVTKITMSARRSSPTATLKMKDVRAWSAAAFYRRGQPLPARDDANRHVPRSAMPASCATSPGRSDS